MNSLRIYLFGGFPIAHHSSVKADTQSTHEKLRLIFSTEIIVRSGREAVSTLGHGESARLLGRREIERWEGISHIPWCAGVITVF